jgi:ribonuclease HI
MALLQAIRFCREMGFTKVHFEGDAKSVIDSVHSDMVYSSGVGHLIEDIKFEIQASQQWKLTFIKREGNMFRIVDAEMFLLIIFVMFCC